MNATGSRPAQTKQEQVMKRTFTNYIYRAAYNCRYGASRTTSAIGRERHFGVQIGAG